MCSEVGQRGTESRRALGHYHSMSTLVGTLDNSHQPTNGLHDVLVEKDWFRGTLETWSIQRIQSVHRECDALQMLKWHWHKMNPKERRANLSNESNIAFDTNKHFVCLTGERCKAHLPSSTQYLAGCRFSYPVLTFKWPAILNRFVSILVSRVGSRFSRHNKMNDWLTDNRNYMAFPTHFRKKAAPTKFRRFPPEYARSLILKLLRFRPDHAQLAWALFNYALLGENWHPSPKICHRLLSV